MSWEQNYVVPSVDHLIEKLIGKSSTVLLWEELERGNIKIISATLIKLQEDDMLGDVMGYKVVLSNGKVYIPKLVKQYTANGNYGCDTYAWKELNEKVKVKKINV